MFIIGTMAELSPLVPSRHGEVDRQGEPVVSAQADVAGARVITDLPPSARSRWNADQMVTSRIDVDGRPAATASGGR